jgi:ubiquinone/menaquinone biosynthesis C-methylase UbiE
MSKAVAFKNFTQPKSALAEMYRVLRSGGTAVIQDMSRDASHADIDLEVRKMELGRLSAIMTKGTLEMLRRDAPTRRLSSSASPPKVPS